MTEALWSHPKSPWVGRISMLASEKGKVSQASFVLSLLESYFRGADPSNRRPGGLFAAPLSSQDGDLLGWTRGQQAAFLVRLWSQIRTSVHETKAHWAEYLRAPSDDAGESTTFTEADDPAMVGEYTLLGREMGVRGVLTVTNDVAYFLAEEMGLREWQRSSGADVLKEGEITDSLSGLDRQSSIVDFIGRLARLVAEFDWRSSATRPALPEQDRNRQALYRAGSGYTEVRRQLHLHVSKSEQERQLAETAKKVLTALWPDR